MEHFENARNVCHIFLDPIRKERRITFDDILQVVNNPLLKQQYPDLDIDELAAQLEADYEIFTGKSTELTETDVKPWLSDARAGISWELWNRYRSWLKTKDGSFPVGSLDDVTDKILDKCVNPKAGGNWDRRGMVVGNVQSGKTANYSGLINKATDAGYKLIIVIAGIHNTLRSQTQLRIDEGYIGRDSSAFIKKKKTVPIGVGEYNTETEIYSYTSSGERGDFNRGVATQINVPIGGKSPTVLVIKKNTRILENLILWLNTFAREDANGDRKIMNVPLLVIDDEADNASVNSGTETDVRSINRLIRTLLNLFNQNTFIGYTATPYANLFIPSEWNRDLQTTIQDTTFKIGEDLFPRDFILNLPPPSNYIGAAEVFGFRNDQTGEEYDGLDIIRPAEDQEPFIPFRIGRENAMDLPDDVPGSLKHAVKAFILSCAVRRVRGHQHKHQSMLVHAVSRVAWIDRIAWLVNELLRDYRLQIKSGQGSLMNELERLYSTDFIPTTQSVLENLKYQDPKIHVHSWGEVKEQLLEAVMKIEVRAVHGTKNTRGLEYHQIEEINYNAYEHGLSVIAVGGNKLARGITLEGLSVSYYLRTVRMYDSLMQMGRWFGYRPGYADVCRVYTTEQLVGWYQHVTMATEEMRADFDELASRNQRPVDFQLKVRTHPGMLMITSIAKMRGHERIQVGYSGKLVQTFGFDKNAEIIRHNYQTFNQLISELSDPEILRSASGGGTNGLLWKNVSANLVNDFLSAVKTLYIRTDVMRPYIEQQNKKGLLTHWNVAVILNSGSTITTKESPITGESVLQQEFRWKNGAVTAGLPARNFGEHSIRELKVKGSKNAILDKRARMIDLGLASTSDEPKIKDARNTSKEPLLVIMPLDPRISKELNPDIPLIGFGVIFPQFVGEETYEYAARPVREDFEEVLQEDDDLDEDE